MPEWRTGGYITRVSPGQACVDTVTLTRSADRKLRVSSNWTPAFEGFPDGAAGSGGTGGWTSGVEAVYLSKDIGFRFCGAGCCGCRGCGGVGVNGSKKIVEDFVGFGHCGQCM